MILLNPEGRCYDLFLILYSNKIILVLLGLSLQQSRLDNGPHRSIAARIWSRENRTTPQLHFVLTFHPRPATLSESRRERPRAMRNSWHTHIRIHICMQNSIHRERRPRLGPPRARVTARALFSCESGELCQGQKRQGGSQRSMTRRNETK